MDWQHTKPPSKQLYSKVWSDAANVDRAKCYSEVSPSPKRHHVSSVGIPAPFLNTTSDSGHPGNPNTPAVLVHMQKLSRLMARSWTHMTPNMETLSLSQSQNPVPPSKGHCICSYSARKHFLYGQLKLPSCSFSCPWLSCSYSHIELCCCPIHIVVVI